MPSLRTLNVHLYRHRWEGWHFLSSPQMTQEQCRSFIVPHVYLEDLAKTAPHLIYVYIDIQPYSHPSYIRDFDKYTWDDSNMKNIRVRMTWKKNCISNTFDIISPIIIQGENRVKNNWIVGPTAHEHEYTSIKVYSNVL